MSTEHNDGEHKDIAHMDTEQRPDQHAELTADIAATRADLAETLTALAAKTQVKSRAEDAAKNALGQLRDRVLAIPGQAVNEAKRLPAQTVNEAKSLWHQVSVRTTPVQRRLSAAAVLAGGLIAGLATARPGKPGSRR